MSTFVLLELYGLKSSLSHQQRICIHEKLLCNWRKPHYFLIWNVGFNRLCYCRGISYSFDPYALCGRYFLFIRTKWYRVEGLSVTLCLFLIWVHSLNRKIDFLFNITLDLLFLNYIWCYWCMIILHIILV